MSQRQPETPIHHEVGIPLIIRFKRMLEGISYFEWLVAWKPAEPEPEPKPYLGDIGNGTDSCDSKGGDVMRKKDRALFTKEELEQKRRERIKRNREIRRFVTPIILSVLVSVTVTLLQH